MINLSIQGASAVGKVKEGEGEKKDEKKEGEEKKDEEKKSKKEGKVIDTIKED